MPSETIVNKARVRSKEVLADYLLHEAHNVHAPHSLIPIKKKKKKKKKNEGIRESSSETELCELRKKKERRKHKKKKKKSTGGYKTENGSTTETSESDWDQESIGEVGSPVYFILSELRKIAPEGKAPRSCRAFDLHGFFDEWTEERKAAYGKDVITAIRERNIDQLRAWHQEGRVLQAANRFGESLLHLACRRGFLDVVKFLIEEASVNLWIRDDTGRTPLHDACWTPKPCFDLVDFLLSIDRDMLFVSDKRGHTPLDYARKDSWDAWIDHFQEKGLRELLPVRSNFYLMKEIKPAETVHGENKILENVDEMIVQLAISARGEDGSRPNSISAGETVDGTSSDDNKSGDNRSHRSHRSSNSRRRRRIRQQREREFPDDDDDDDDSIGSMSRKSNPLHRRSNPDVSRH